MLVPVAPWDQAKQRLAGLLDPDERVELMRVTTRTVLGAALEAGLPVTVLSPEPGLRDELPPGVSWLDEEAGLRGLNAQLEAGVRRLGGGAVLIVHGDLPAAGAGDFRAIVSGAAPHPGVTIATSPDGGTNAMLLDPAGGFALQYGRDSAAKHAEAARAAGYHIETVETPGFALDLDTPDSLRRLLETPEGSATPAGRYLAGLGIAERLERHDAGA